MPNLNAAVACAQLEKLDFFLRNKRELAQKYDTFFNNTSLSFYKEKDRCQSNYWLNALILKNRADRDLWLEQLNNNQIMSRPIWKLLNKLPHFQSYQKTALTNAEWLEDRVINLPSSVRSP